MVLGGVEAYMGKVTACVCTSLLYNDPLFLFIIFFIYEFLRCSGRRRKSGFRIIKCVPCYCCF